MVGTKSIAGTSYSGACAIDRQQADQPRAIPFYIHTPPMAEVNQNLPPKNQRSKVPPPPTSEIA